MQESVEARPRVYVLEQQAHDYAPAQAYGELVFLETKRLAPDAPNAGTAWNYGVLHQLQKALSGYVHGVDFIIPTGAPSKMLVVGSILASKGRVHNVLGWDPKTQRYLNYKVEV